MSAQFIFTMYKVGRVVPPEREVLKDISLSFYPGAKIGVIGPNGSGKSNLSDAVRWVLGETSSRQLRAAGKMEDVIFGGTRRRGAMGFAMVRLTLDNSAHTLDIDADEAVIGRKYYRSGESEYTINGQLCRLKDIYELLLDTGIGRDGYSVIGQGRIAEIVAAKSSENYGFEVIDLGRDVPVETVVDTVREKDVHLVGLSALMTTTLKSMEETIAALHAAKLDCKVMVGGAVLTPEYAEKIGADWYAKDAKQSADIAKKFFGES